MYRYDNYDRQMLQDRIAQFRDQTRRFLAVSQHTVEAVEQLAASLDAFQAAQ